jgi:hypothetical protein
MRLEISEPRSSDPAGAVNWGNNPNLRALHPKRKKHILIFVTVFEVVTLQGSTEACGGRFVNPHLSLE